MSTSFTFSDTITFSVTHARHMAAKVATDLKRMQRFYGAPSDAWIDAERPSTGSRRMARSSSRPSSTRRGTWPAHFLTTMIPVAFAPVPIQQVPSSIAS